MLLPLSSSMYNCLEPSLSELKTISFPSGEYEGEVFIERSKTQSQESFWNNYDLIIWKKDSGGITSIKGMFKENTWGTAERIAVANNGIWKLPTKYVRHFK